MNKSIKMIGKGFIYGVKHPYLDEPMERSKDMTTIDGLLGDIGMSISQGTIQTIIGYGTAIALLIAVGYISKKINDADLNFKMTVEPNEKKKRVKL